VLNHGKPEFTPSYFASACGAGFGGRIGPWFEKGPVGGGRDGFGVMWVTPESGGGAHMPLPGEFILDDITKFRETVTFPDVDALDWEAEAKKDLADCDRTEVAVDFGSGNGIFERLAAMMGFENALTSMALEPEACYDFYSAVTDYKIKVAEKVAKYFKADTFTNYDDIAMEKGPFMSPATYRELIKPNHKRLNDAVRDLGMIPIYHCCGKAESLIEDFIETGAAAWTSVQPCNDIVTLLKKYGDRIAIMGGFRSNGRAGLPDAGEDEVRAEVRRCFNTYGIYSAYVFFGSRLISTMDPKVKAAAIAPLHDEAMKCSIGGRK